MQKQLAKSGLSLDWVEQYSDTDKQVWLCVNYGCDLTVIKSGNNISAYSCGKQLDTFNSVYGAIKWAETVWLLDNV